jgi:hypothetical protein
MASKKKSTKKRVPAHIDPLTGDFVAAHLVVRGVRQMERPVRAMLAEWLVKEAIALMNVGDNYADQLDARLNFPKHYLPKTWKASRREK